MKQYLQYINWLQDIFKSLTKQSDYGDSLKSNLVSPSMVLSEVERALNCFTRVGVFVFQLIIDWIIEEHVHGDGHMGLLQQFLLVIQRCTTASQPANRFFLFSTTLLKMCWEQGCWEDINYVIRWIHEEERT